MIVLLTLFMYSILSFATQLDLNSTEAKPAFKTKERCVNCDLGEHCLGASSNPPQASDFFLNTAVSELFERSFARYLQMKDLESKERDKFLKEQTRRMFEGMESDGDYMSVMRTALERFKSSREQ